MSRERVRLGGNYRKLYAATAVSNIGDGMAALAYPWLATAVTRNPLLVALVAAAGRLPWLLFTLPAGVITDRVDRRRAMVATDAIRGVVTLFVAFAVLAEQGTLPSPDELDAVVGTRVGLYLLLIVATLLLGCAEVLRDNCGQTFMPSIVPPEHLERANGRMWAAEAVSNTYIGPPLGSLFLVAAFSVPFFIDSASFLVSAALLALIPGAFRAAAPDAGDEVERPGWRAELAEGWRWLRANRLLWSMAIILGLMNMADNISGAVFVLYAQDVLDTTPLKFTLLGFGGAFGGIVGSYVAPWMSRRFGSGTCLAIVLGSTAVTQFVIGFLSSWLVVAAVFMVGALLGSSWNVITVSLRQTIIPPRLLGRVNSVYRFFAWGMIPIGATLGGAIVWAVERTSSRDTALRSVWWVSGVIHVGLFLAGLRLLSTDRLERARTDGIAALASAEER
jgi:MFS family permease